MVKISIIIPTLNEEGYIEKTLSILKPQLQEGDEIIVVDSHSKDKTIAIAKKFGARIVNIKKCGTGPAKTFGTKHAKNQIVAFLDADGYVAKDWAKRVKKYFENADVNAVIGYNSYTGPTILRRFIYSAVSWIVFQIGKLNYMINKIPWLPPNSTIKKDVFLKYGGFSDALLEELDFGVHAKGLKNVIYDSKIKVQQSDRRFAKQGFLKTFWMWYKADMAILKKGKMGFENYDVVR